MYVSVKDYSLFQSIYSIKADIIEKNKKLQNKSFYFKYKTNILEDNKTLYEYHIKKSDKLEIVFKSEGGTLAKGLLIFIWVMVFLFYFFMLLLGFMPFIAFIIPNILIKGLLKIIDFFYDLTHPNNFMNSVLYFLKAYMIPFMNFIFEYFGLFIFGYILTFFCLYHIYYYAKKENVCAAYNTTRVVSLLTSILTVIFYFIANIASVFRTLASFLPEIIRQPFINLANKISRLRLIFIGKVPYIGKSQVRLIDSLSTMFKGIGYLKLYGNPLLDNWDLAMELIKSDDARKFTQEEGIDKFIDYIRIIEKAESHYVYGTEITNKNRKNAEELEEIVPCVNPSATAYFLRFLFQNIMKLTIDMTFFIDICKANGQYEKVKEQIEGDFIQMIESQKKKLTDQQRKEKDQQRKEKIEEFVEKMKKIRLDDVINIDCLINTIINGATFSSLLTFLFLILFIVFFFVKL